LILSEAFHFEEHEQIGLLLKQQIDKSETPAISDLETESKSISTFSEQEKSDLLSSHLPNEDQSKENSPNSLSDFSTSTHSKGNVIVNVIHR
jgi:hypothetical protein